MAMPLPLPTFTTEDVRAFPDDGQRYELLEGMLLVTPAPALAHQIVLSRLLVELERYLSEAGAAWVVSPGEIEIGPKTLLEPDLLVIPATYPPATPWRTIREWWLAAEAFSPSSRVYDRDYKRDAYLALGVAEVWLMDLDEHAVFVSRRDAPGELRHEDRLVWHPAAKSEPLTIEMATLFRGMP